MKRTAAKSAPALLLAIIALLVFAFATKQELQCAPKGKAKTNSSPATNSKSASGDETWADKVRKDMGFSQAELQATSDKGELIGKCPLKHTDVSMKITGFIARVTVRQQFENPFKDRIEAVYVFPLAQSAAVDDMTMIIGDRTIRGVIKTKEDARKIYDDAKATGHTAALLEQYRPNIFTQSVANIMPGEKIDITITYTEYLKYEEGTYEIVFPMVVGPRYIPGNAAGAKGTGWAPDTDKVPDASRITPPVTPEGTRAGHDISLKVRLDAGFPVTDITSRLHDVDIKHLDGGEVEISLKDKEMIPNKDFILKYRTAGKKIDDAVLTHNTSGNDGYFTLIIQPPDRPAASEIRPKEMIFVIDSSGSQQGWPIEKAKETMKYAIRNMNPQDTFNLMSFSNDVIKLFDKPQLNTAANREKALRYLGSRAGDGGTEMKKAILAALTPPPDPKRIRIVCFMTDGYVGDDMDILDSIRRRLEGARLFSFGVGNSTNRFLLDEMAIMGRGEVEYVTLEDSGEAAAKRFYDRIANPVLTDIEIDWDGLPVTDIYPTTIPDLYSAKPLVIKGRYTGAAKGTVKISGKTSHGDYNKEIKVSLPGNESGNAVLAPLWARARIDELMRKDFRGIQNGSPEPDIKKDITELGLKYRIMTQFTSFVAVEEKQVTENGVPKTITVPVEMPDGVSYDGIFGKDDKEETMKTKSAANMPGTVSYSATGAGFGGGSGSTSPAKPVAVSPSIAGNYRVAAEKDAFDEGELYEPKPVERLAQELRGIAAKVAKQGKAGNLKINSIVIANWQTVVTIKLSALSDKNIAELKKLGFVEVSRDATRLTITGKIDVRKLDALSKLKSISYIEPKK